MEECTGKYIWERRVEVRFGVFSIVLVGFFFSPAQAKRFSRRNMYVNVYDTTTIWFFSGGGGGVVCGSSASKDVFIFLFSLKFFSLEKL